MRFNCGPTREAKDEARKSWHPWFAWYPVRVGPRECVWLQTVERKGTFGWYANLCGDVVGCWDYEYRSL